MSRLARMISTVLAAGALLVPVEAPAHEGHHHTAMGTVKAIETARLDLEARDGKLETFVLSERTAYRRGEAAAKREDIHVGERAVVMYETDGGRNVALEVRLGERKGSQSP